ncbi:MAG TPA: carboxypeptidase regulatory-like domain-containing protein [Panacibacter sp.]|nr:carboxypeptidase regulatory-like domain-containing protein [Panacibacter sp.]HNP45155.1 carboxypeptidase regulatory-like domain-containing protein [Panacibacter sp.]
MKNKIFGLGALAIASALFAFTKFDGGVIKGKVTPAEAVQQVWAMSATDTLKSAVTNGSFELANAKAGTYKVYIDAAEPYKDVVKDNVQVSDGGTADLGNITLEK